LLQKSIRDIDEISINRRKAATSSQCICIHSPRAQWRSFDRSVGSRTIRWWPLGSFSPASVTKRRFLASQFCGIIREIWRKWSSSVAWLCEIHGFFSSRQSRKKAPRCE